MPNGHVSDYTARGVANPWARVKPRPRQRPDPCEEPCTPRCPACGGLQCLCRPRFFPGQLLTDEDLNRLQRYVLDKNRLHNRYLHGWGVACGLEVVCDPCDPRHVVVRTGYALSPCGDDIVVCADQSVDVCDLIEACQPREPICEGPYDAPPRDCRGGVDRWVLAICYDEKPVRGITAQLGAGDTTASARCKCGGSAGCGCGASGGTCGCGGGTHQHGANGTGCSCGGTGAKPSNGRKGYKPQCEPTQICEGFRFIAYPAPPADARLDLPDNVRGLNSDLLWAWLYANRSRFGPLLERVLCCVTRAMELRASIRQGKVIDRQFAITTYTQYAAALAEFAADFAIHRCSFVSRTVELRQEASNWKWEAAAGTNAKRLADLSRRVSVLDVTWFEIVSECLCSALLPACPRPAATNCVPLAVVTLKTGECRVVDICNWSERKILISWPTISYWLSWLPWNRLRKWISDICCGPQRDREAYRLLMLMFGVMFSQMKSAAAAEPTALHAMMAERAGVEGAAAAEARAADPFAEALAADDLLSHMLGNFERLRAEGPASAGEPAWAGVLAGLSQPAAVAGDALDRGSVTELAERLKQAENRLEKQQKEITTLKRKVGR
jgi:hypothetical protein